MSAIKTNAVNDPQQFVAPCEFMTLSQVPRATGITASTTQTQVGATALVAEYNLVATCANANDSVRLPAAVAGSSLHIRNSGAANLKIWPASGETCNGGTEDAADTTVLATTATRTYVSFTDGDWTIFSV